MGLQSSWPRSILAMTNLVGESGRTMWRSDRSPRPRKELAMSGTSGYGDVDLVKVDLTDLSYFEDGPPYPLFARMRSEASPRWNAPTGDEPGFWSFTRAKDIQAISRDAATFS